MSFPLFTHITHFFDVRCICGFLSIRAGQLLDTQQAQGTEGHWGALRERGGDSRPTQTLTGCVR